MRLLYRSMSRRGLYSRWKGTHWWAHTSTRVHWPGYMHGLRRLCFRRILVPGPSNHQDINPAKNHRSLGSRRPWIKIIIIFILSCSYVKQQEKKYLFTLILRTDGDIPIGEHFPWHAKSFPLYFRQDKIISHHLNTNQLNKPTNNSKYFLNYKYFCPRRFLLSAVLR